MSFASLPSDIVALERGWLSSNNVLLLGPDQSALVDSGYGTHAEQTTALIRARLGERPLDVLVNTHLHSDHCGGNAALQTAYPALQTFIPPGQSAAVQSWDTEGLSYAPTGQYCPRFGFDELLVPGKSIVLGQRTWDVHAAPGHDPHSIVLFQPSLGLLISADALWAQGFGVVFPEIEGIDAFDSVGATLDLIESLRPRTVIPGHGAVFDDIQDALSHARRRLEQFMANPLAHARYAAKVLVKFKLLEVQRIAEAELRRWVARTPYFATLHHRHFGDRDFDTWLGELGQDLVRSGAAELAQSDGQRYWLNR